MRLGVRVALGKRRKARDGMLRRIVDVLRHQSDVDSHKVGGQCGLESELMSENASDVERIENERSLCATSPNQLSPTAAEMQSYPLAHCHVRVHTHPTRLVKSPQSHETRKGRASPAVHENNEREGERVDQS